MSLSLNISSVQAGIINSYQENFWNRTGFLLHVQSLLNGMKVEDRTFPVETLRSAFLISAQKCDGRPETKEAGERLSKVAFKLLQTQNKSLISSFCENWDAFQVLREEDLKIAAYLAAGD